MFHSVMTSFFKGEYKETKQHLNTSLFSNRVFGNYS